MTGAPATVGFVTAGEHSPEQRAALSWARDALPDVRTVALEGLGTADLDAFDVLWWHRGEPATGSAVAADLAPLARHVDDGGRLLLGLGAVAAVEPLGVDPVAPDAAGTEWLDEPLGLLVAAVHADHPAFASVDGLRVTTRGGGVEAPCARYADVLPARGDVLAATRRGGADHPAEASVVSWTPGDGLVVGAGSGVAFADPTEAGHANRRAAVVRDLLAFLARGDPPATARGRPKSGAELGLLREALADDPHRPAFHLSPPANWLNDPNGLVRWDGRYHVFYQYNPGGPCHHAIHWGHAVSDDLVHWEDEPVALAPSPDGPDRDGCWSGCAVDDGGTARVLYTGGRGRDQLPCLATAADPDLRRWVKDEGNPVIEAPPRDLDLLETEHWTAEFRDHSVWRDGDRWYQLIGSGVEDVGGTALLYESTDLRDWSHVGPVLVGDWEGAGAVWECPELLDFGDRQLLHVSNYDEVAYFLGALDVESPDFAVATTGTLDHGDLYAPQSLRDDDGRYLTWGWVPEARDGAAQWDAGWSGTLSLPRRLSLGADGELRQRPPEELRELRAERLASVDGSVTPSDPVPLGRGRAVELAGTVAAGDADALALDLLASPTGRERTTLRVADERVTLDRSSASTSGAVDAHPHHLPRPDDGGAVDLRVFVDGSVVEVFVDGRECLTGRVYPTRPDSDGLALRAVGGDARVDSLDAWRLDGVW